MKKIILIALPIALIAFGAWFFSDTQVIKRRSAAIIETLELSEGSSRIARAGKSQALRDLLADQVTIIYPDGNNIFKSPIKFSLPITLTNDRITTAHTYLTETVDYMNVENLKIGKPTIQDTTATADVSLKLTAKLKKASEQSTSLDGTFLFTKTKKGWRLSKATFKD